jgi:transposase
MKPLSQDLRERAVAAYAAGGPTQRQVAQRFGVSQHAVSKLWRQQQQVGHLHPLYPHRQGGYKITEVKRQHLEALLTRQPDLTLAEIKQRLRLNCTPAAISYVLQRLGYTRKKRRSAPRNNSVRTLPRHAPRGPGDNHHGSANA